MHTEGSEFESRLLHMKFSWDCFDCKVDTKDEYYMVLDEIWEEFGCGDDLLCIGCLENRVGRNLVRADFNDYPINDIDLWNKSPRLLNRLMS